MLVHRRITPSIKFAGTHSYTWVERGTVGVKCLAQEHNTMSPARARTRTARSGVKRTNHEATANHEAPPLLWAGHTTFLPKNVCLSQGNIPCFLFACVLITAVDVALKNSCRSHENKFTTNWCQPRLCPHK